MTTKPETLFATVDTENTRASVRFPSVNSVFSVANVFEFVVWAEWLLKKLIKTNTYNTFCSAGIRGGLAIKKNIAPSNENTASSVKPMR